MMDDKIKIIHNKAIVFYKEKRFNEAIQLWQKALEVNPQEVEVLYSLGLIYFEMKKYEDSVHFLKQLLELSPGHYKAMLIIGTAYIKLRKFDRAEEYIQKSIEINPNHKLAFLNLGAIYSVQKKFAQGIEMFNKAIELSPKEIRAYLGLAKIYAIQGDAEEANRYFKQVIELDPNGKLGSYAKKALIHNDSFEGKKGIEQHYTTGYKLFLKGFFHEAIKQFETYLEYNPKDDLVQFLLAESLLRSGNLKKSFVHFKKAILSNSRKALYYKELALLLDNIGNPNDVLEILAKATELGKDDSLIHFLQGKSYNRLQRYDDAVVALKQAIKLDRNNLAARLELAKAYQVTGELDLAQNQVNFIENHPLESPLKAKAQKMVNVKRA